MVVSSAMSSQPDSPTGSSDSPEFARVEAFAVGPRGETGGVVTAAVPSIPDFELLRPIGRGSYGDVWLARAVTGMLRAIKIVWRERFAEPEPFEREFRGMKEFAAISLDDATQMALLHVGRNDTAGFFYYVMELADDAEHGRAIDPASYTPLTLAELRRRRGRLPAEECVRLGAELAQALASLHRRGLVHRDIKPSNVIFVGARLKLADVGLVTLASSAQTFVGTEGFVPPDGPGSPSADVYALGKVLYELATGLDRQRFPKLPDALRALPDWRGLLALNEVIMRACEPQRDKRYADAAALLAELEILCRGRPVRRFARWELVAAAGLFAAAIGATLWSGRREAPLPTTPAGHPGAGAAAPAAKTTPARKARSVATLTRNAEAYDAYVTGRALQTRAAAKAGEAAKFFERAVELDPVFAVAWVRLAETRFRPYTAATNRSPATLESAREALARALELEPELPEALEFRGVMRFVEESDFEGARRDLARAEALQGPTADSLFYRLLIDWRFGDRTNIRPLMREAMAADPENGGRANLIANLYCALPDFVEADRLYQRAMVIGGTSQQNAFTNRVHLRRQWRGGEAALRLIDQAPANQQGVAIMRATLLLGLGRVEEARAVLERFERPPPTPMFLAEAGLMKQAREMAEDLQKTAQAEFDRGNRGEGVQLMWIESEIVLGRPDSAAAALEVLRAEREKTYAWGALSANITRLYAQVGNREAVVSRMRQAVADGYPLGYELSYNSAYAPHRNDPRIQEIMRQAEARVAAMPDPEDEPAAAPPR